MRSFFCYTWPLIKVVLFDAGGVLHASNSGQAEDLMTELGLSRAQLNYLYEEYLPLFGKGQITEEQLWLRAHEDFGIRLVTPDEKLFTRTFEPNLQKMPGMYELVDELKAQGYIVGLLTNVTPPYAEVLEIAGHYDPFDIKILSCEVHSWKPEVEIFQIALDRVKASPEETIFIDDLKENADAACKLGIHGLLYTDTENLIKELSGLLKLN